MLYLFYTINLTIQLERKHFIACTYTNNNNDGIIY